MNLTIMSFLVLDSSTTEFKKGRYSISGNVYLPIGNVVPIIRKGHGCVGLADIKSIEMDENITLIKYKYVSINDNKVAKAYYDLYLNNSNSNSSSGDFYENTDQLIPGAMGLKPAASWDNKKSKKSKNHFMDEEDIW